MGTCLYLQQKSAAKKIRCTSFASCLAKRLKGGCFFGFRGGLKKNRRSSEGNLLNLPSLFGGEWITMKYIIYKWNIYIHIYIIAMIKIIKTTILWYTLSPCSNMIYLHIERHSVIMVLVRTSSPQLSARPAFLWSSRRPLPRHGKSWGSLVVGQL